MTSAACLGLGLRALVIDYYILLRALGNRSLHVTLRRVPNNHKVLGGLRNRFLLSSPESLLSSNQK